MNAMFQSITRAVRPALAKPLSQLPRYAPLQSAQAVANDDANPSASNRTFTTLVPLRPSLTPLTVAIRRTALPTTFTPSTTTGVAADVVPTSAISAHPALGASQIRCGPRNTMNGHTRLVQKRRHGFLFRMRSRTGRKILQRRRIKGRKNIAA